MAAHTVTIFADANMKLFHDEEKKRPFQSVLYQASNTTDHTTYYMDQGLSVKVEIHVLGLEEGEGDDPGQTSTTPAPANLNFDKAQTLFLIDLMRQKLEADGDELPKSLYELNKRVKLGKGSKREMWKDMAGKLGEQFKMSFDSDRVARKWATLEDGYKKVKDNNRSTGKGAMRFQFFNEMEELLGGHHDVEFPVVGTSAGIEIRRPDQLATEAASLPPPTSTPSRRKRAAEEGDLVELLRESEAASQQRHAEMMQQMRASQQSFEEMFKSYMEKFTS